ncbi:MAG TPA: MarR family winged helix-turn-helix transcriptional regulator [Solirubrobacteraceae bacterium]|nr:MarR family winged helix-turn-helix transcriptional regulator [Solirubrobacteraceae bacterium]
MRSSTSSPQAREDARAPREAPGAQAAQRRAQTPEAGEIASDLRAVLSTLIRRLRAENRFPLAHAAVLSRLEREGERCVSELAAAERVRPQSMAQTVADLEAEGLVQRRPDPADRRRAPLTLTDKGRQTIAADRRRREGWLAQEISSSLSERERRVLAEALALLQRIAAS